MQIHRNDKEMESNQFDFKIFDTLLEPVFVLDQTQAILYCNEPASIIADISARKILRQKMLFSQLFQFSTPIETLQSLNNLTEATPYIEVNFQATTGKTGKTQLTIQPLNQEYKLYLVFFRDVTLEETLQKKYRAELDQKEDVIKDLQKARAELEKYSQNLEKLVEERSQQIVNLNRLMTALLNSLEQGFFIFDQQGLVLEVCSKAAEQMLGFHPKGKHIWEALGLKAQQVDGIKKWLTTLFSEMLPFEDLAPLGPNKLNTTDENQFIKLEYYPLRREQSLDAVVVVATDITRLVAAETAAAHDRAQSQMILSLVKHKQQALSFMQEGQRIIANISHLLQNENLDPDQLFICLHTLKGGAASFSISSISEQAHHCEDLLSQWKNENKNETRTLLIENCSKLITEWQTFCTQSTVFLGQWQKNSSRMVEIAIDSLKQFSEKIEKPSIKSELIEQYIKRPILEYFEQYQEIAQAVAEREGKLLSNIEFIGGDLKIIPENYQSLFSTFIHAFRNAVDHGIETPEEREMTGKDKSGHIQVCFEKKNKNIQITIKDDGRGINVEKIKSKLSEKGIDHSHENEQQIIQHVFDSQFSTKDFATDLSGRGVGMDAILKAAQTLGGSAQVF